MTGQTIDKIAKYLQIKKKKSIRHIARDLSISQNVISDTLNKYDNLFIQNFKNEWAIDFKSYQPVKRELDNLGEVYIYEYSGQFLDQTRNTSNEFIELLENISSFYSNINLIANEKFNLKQIEKLNKLDFSILDLAYLIEYKLLTFEFFKAFNNQTEYFQSLIIQSYCDLKSKLSNNYIWMNQIHNDLDNRNEFIFDSETKNNDIFNSSFNGWHNILDNDNLASLLNYCKYENEWLPNIKYGHLNFHIKKKRSLFKLQYFIETNLSEFLYKNFKLNYIWDQNVSNVLLNLPFSILYNISEDKKFSNLIFEMERNFQFSSLKDIHFFRPECKYFLENIEIGNFIYIKNILSNKI